VHANSFRSVRGRTLLARIFDEPAWAMPIEAPPISFDGSSEGIDTDSNTASQLQPKGIDKSVLALARHVATAIGRYVTLQPCLLCARKPSDEHHLRFVQPPRALGRNASNEFAVPLCGIHHRAAHRATNERTWEA
jgi:hypothetical protein